MSNLLRDIVSSSVVRALRMHHAPGSEMAQAVLAGEIADDVIARMRYANKSAGTLIEFTINESELDLLCQTLADTYCLSVDSREFIDGQIIDVGEEAGELLGAYRRWTNRARQSGSLDEVGAEWADVMIASIIGARLCGIDMPSAMRDKYEKVMTRGWKNP